MVVVWGAAEAIGDAGWRAGAGRVRGWGEHRRLPTLPSEDAYIDLPATEGWLHPLSHPPLSPVPLLRVPAGAASLSNTSYYV